jgi:hypothetical protein
LLRNYYLSQFVLQLDALSDKHALAIEYNTEGLWSEVGLKAKKVVLHQRSS